MKIHVLLQGARFTGGRLVLLGHANELARRGHEVKVWIAAEPRIDWLEMIAPVGRFEVKRIARLPPAEVCIFERYSLAAPVLRAARGIPVHFCQGFEGTDAENRLARVLKTRGRLLGLFQWLKFTRRLRQIGRSYRLPTAKLVVHPHLVKLIADRFDQQAHLVPNGLPRGRFTPLPSRSFAGRTVLIVGPTDTPSKRVVDALLAVKQLKKTLPDVRLVRISPHEMWPAEGDLNVVDEFHTMIAPEQMPAFYQRADLLIAPYDSAEGFGLPVLEAMACGMPVLASDIPAFRTFAAPDDYARFVPVGDSAAMAQAAADLLSSPDERQRLSLRGIEVAGGYTQQRSFDAMEAALLQITRAESPEVSHA